jgi:hypothetical protein
MRQQMQADLPGAMKRRDRARTSILRTTLAAIANAESVDLSLPTSAAGLFADVERKQLSDSEIRQIVEDERDTLRLWAQRLRRLDRSARADELDEQAEFLDSYLCP